MALRVGMRVKKVRGRENIGLTGVVVSVGDYPAGMGTPDGGYIRNRCDICVMFDGAWLTSLGNPRAATTPAYSQAEKFEPIQPEGQKPVEWSQCLWQPEHIREGVGA